MIEMYISPINLLKASLVYGYVVRGDCFLKDYGFRLSQAVDSAERFDSNWALLSANVPSRLKPTGLDRADASEVCAAANQAEQTKIKKYSYITSHAYHSFTPVAFETTGVCGPRSKSFLTDLGRRIANTTGHTKLVLGNRCLKHYGV
eukprot:Em0010g215a